ncbi:MAG: hypothetical protein NC201_02070 [Prevotella sp.]|nr:hypothetical protein [Bacteroides sp.]MCM1366014.1 hypothetical protein [Prevotella sp.]MCM1436916.1 hypothetical protein [Prevotella sp.]
MDHYNRHNYDDPTERHRYNESNHHDYDDNYDDDYDGIARDSEANDDDDHDYFSGPDLPDPPSKQQKKPVLKPEDPDYWEQDESEWEHLKPSSPVSKWMIIAASAIVLALFIAIYLRYFSPIREAATEVGYVERIETRGYIFKTIEGVLLPYKDLKDNSRTYTHDFIFTAQNKEVASKIYSAMIENRPIRVTYKEYAAPLPWRGESKILVTSATVADPTKILPPDRQPQVP